MFLNEYNFYISDNHLILFDLNLFRIFSITEKIKLYFVEQKFSEDMSEEEKEVLNQILSVEQDIDSEPQKINAVKIHVSNACNLRCKYCYAEGGNYGKCSKLMNLEIAEKIVRYINTSEELKHINYITFFGGEPLLNPEIIEYICENTCQREVEYLLQTNGTVLDDNILRILKKYHIILTISLDGPEEINDFNRIDLKGNGTYKKIIENLQKMKEYGILTQAVEATLSKEFIDYYSKVQIADFIYDVTGIKEIKVDYDCNLDRSDFSGIGEIKAFFERCMEKKYILDNGACNVISRFLSQTKSEYICSAGNGIISIDVEGNIFPCQLFMTNNLFQMGNIEEPHLKSFLPFTKKEYRISCKKCSARSFCNVCCAAGIKEQDCEEQRRIQKMTLEFFAQMIAEGHFEEFYNNFSVL